MSRSNLTGRSSLIARFRNLFSRISDADCIPPHNSSEERITQSNFQSDSQTVGDDQFLWPTDLSRSPSPLRRILFIGTCRDDNWTKHSIDAPGDLSCPADFILFHHALELPDETPHPASEYSLQVLFPPLRRILPENDYFRISPDDTDRLNALLAECKLRIDQYLSIMMKYNKLYNILTIVQNFPLPQRNPLGRLMPRYRLGNIVYFIEQLNEHLYNSVIAYFNSYMLDIDEIISVYGRRHYQNDVVHISNDGGALSDFDFNFDKDRIQNIVPISDIYPSRVYDYILHTIREIHAIYKTISQVDSVKLVIVDLDDTLWRGIAAERTDGYFEAMEGWPLGLIEALGYLKKRGVLLAIVSKNGHEKIERIWPHLAGHERLPLSDFSICRINWKPKADNIEEILGIINILPRNVVFIDDNPVERESVKAAFPKIRTFGPNPYLWRRVLLWSPETQVAAITNESASRTEMIQSQVLREEQRKILSRSEFLKTLQLSIIVHRINEINDRHFPRAFELINKSNQFNTTGKRWTSQQFSQYFAGGGCIYSFEVEDRFTKYGSVGSVVVRHSFIEQFVMSCRVLGMEVEIAVVANISNYIESAGDNVVTGQLIETDANGPCRDLYSRCGFTVSDKKSGKWSKARYSRLEIPEHINFLSSEI